MSWYQVLIVLPKTDGDAENGFCEPQWWNEMVQAQNESAAIAAANAKARADWETSDGECPCGRELGMGCPVCTSAQAVTDEEYNAWAKAMENSDLIPF